MKNKVNIIILLIWCIIVAFCVVNHEIWRDEAQVWCVVRDLGLSEIYQVTRVEGHPMLWYLLVLPFAKFGFPIETMQVISSIFVFASLLILLYKSPFDILQKILITFCAGMVYFLPVIARNYALMPLFLFLLAYFYNQRKEKPYVYSLLLILLSQTHILMLGFCGILFILFIWENVKNRANLPAIILLLINFLFLIYSFILSGNENVTVSNYSKHQVDMLGLLNNFVYIYFNPVFKYSTVCNFILFYGWLGCILYYLFKQDKKVFLIFTASFAYIFYIFAKVWFGGVSYQKAFVLTLILIFCIWVTSNASNQLKKALSMFLCLSVILSVSYIYLDVKYPFSCVKQVVEFVKGNIKDKEIAFLGYPCTISPISGYLPDKKFYSLDENRYVSYFDFRRDYDDKKSKNHKFKYYIVQEDSFLFEELGYKLIFSSDEEIVGPLGQSEVYKIYEKI